MASRIRTSLRCLKRSPRPRSTTEPLFQELSGKLFTVSFPRENGRALMMLDWRLILRRRRVLLCIVVSLVTASLTEGLCGRRRVTKPLRGPWTSRKKFVTWQDEAAKVAEREYAVATSDRRRARQEGRAVETSKLRKQSRAPTTSSATTLASGKLPVFPSTRTETEVWWDCKRCAVAGEKFQLLQHDTADVKAARRNAYLRCIAGICLKSMGSRSQSPCLPALRVFRPTSPDYRKLRARSRNGGMLCGRSTPRRDGRRVIS